MINLTNEARASKKYVIPDWSERRIHVLMHVCCGPCAVWPVKRFTEDEGFELSTVFYNPNIHPKDEFERRKEGAIQLARSFAVPIAVYNDFMPREWEEFERANACELQSGRPKRCEMCYDTRLKFVAKKAKERGFDAFTTSLLISPYQDHNLIKMLGEKYQDMFDIKFYYEDFRSSFRDGQKMAREMGIYRQKYCGCIISLSQQN